MSKRLVLLAVALIALGAAWEVASPWWTLKTMRDASTTLTLAGADPATL